MITGALLIQLGSYTLFRLEWANPPRRSILLYPMLFSSIFLWVFVGSSLVLCTVFLEEYAVNRSIARFVLGSSILISVALSGLMTVLARRFAFPKALSKIIGEPYSDPNTKRAFTLLCERMGMANVELREARLGNAFSLSTRGRKIVAVSPFLFQSLSGEEGEAVLAHELSHIRNRDSLAKGLARFARFAFPYDPVIRLTEAAVHRERELLADLSAATSTQRPLALASALVKAHSATVAVTRGIRGGLFVGGSKRGLLSLHPDLERRIQLLLKVAERMRPSQLIPV